MARVETIVVGGGIGAGTPFALNGFPYVASIDPPLLATTTLLQRKAPPNEAILVSNTGADPEAADTSTVLRVLGGFASYSPGTLNRSYGDDISIDSSRSGCTCIGRGITIAATGGNNCVLVGNTLTVNSATATVIGQNISIGTSYNFGNIIIGGSGTLGNGGGGASGQNVIIGNTILVGIGVIGNNLIIAAAAMNIGNTQSGNVYVGTSVTAGDSSLSNTGLGESMTFGSNTQRNLLLGNGHTANHNRNVLIGLNLTSAADNQCVIGNTIQDLATIVFGVSGGPSVNAHDVTLRLTDEVGTDIAGHLFTIRGGLGTGNAFSGGVAFSIGVPLASGATLQTATQFAVMGINAASGAYGLNINAPNNQAGAVHFDMNASGFPQCIGMAGANNQLINGSTQGELCIRSNRDILFSADGGGTTQIVMVQTTGVLTYLVDRAVRFDNQTNAAGAAAGTLGNAPTAGDPGHWLKINIGGTNFAIPCWAG
jgi:hypothetical protein